MPLSVLTRITRYAERCISGKEPACQKHIWACERLLRDVERIPDDGFPYEWNEDEAKRIVKWFSYLRHSKGALAGQPIELTDWQQFFLGQIYGWRKKSDGLRRFKKSFIEVGRKNAKSQMLSGVSLYEISVTAAKNGEVQEAYTAGTKREQSKIVYNECRLMTRGSILATKFRFKRDAIVHYKSESFIKPLSKQDGKSGDGTNPALLILDEYHQHPTTEFYDLFLGANHKEPLLMIITTAGRDLTFPCYTQEYQYVSRILDPNVDVWNDEYFADVCEADPGDDPGALKTWKKANPIRANYPQGVKKIRDEWVIAKEIPEKMIAFRTKMLDQWVQAKDSGYMDMAKWQACRVDGPPKDFHGAPVYVGFDMSAKIDLTSVAFVIPYKDTLEDGTMGADVKYFVRSHSFIPSREKLREHLRVDKVPYDAWEEGGYLTVTDTPIVDQEAVLEYVMRTCEENGWKIECLCFDPANAGKLMMDLSNDGYDVEEVFQSHKSLNESTQGFREQVYCGNILHEKNPLLDYALSNAVIRTNNGLIKIDKDATRKRIDPVDAVLCAFKLALYHDFDEVNYQEYLDNFLEDL